MEDKVFELLTKMYSDMMNKFNVIDEQFKGINRKLDEKADKRDIVRIENEINPKVNALFDGYKQHTEILERIEKEVSRQDEIIMRRIK